MNYRDINHDFSKARERFGGILQICASISVAEDFLVVEFGSPQNISLTEREPKFAPMFFPAGRIDGVDHYDDWDNSAKLPEYASLQAQLSEYKRQLRREIERVAKSSR
jgi:hypothetical protein